MKITMFSEFTRRRYVGMLLVMASVLLTTAAATNRAPYFAHGGDMAKFALAEGTAVGSPVYRIQGVDPEGGPVHYSISGQHFVVDRDSGIVSLVRPLDREVSPIIEVIISITDDPLGEGEPNTVSLRREIPILDENDNVPEFSGRPYSAVVSEAAKPGTIVFSNIIVSDADAAQNSEIVITCVSGGCEKFDINTEKIAEGQYKGIIILREMLDFESATSYSLTIMASDQSTDNPLSATANVAINVRDVQDQPPIFLNAPYSATLQENTSPGFQVLQIKVKDGDVGDPRPILLSIEGDTLGYFKLVKNSLVTSHVPIDRENPEILQNGGVYTFNVKATELINNELPGDYSYERVTIVITDVDDQIPQFNKPLFHINVSEDIALGTPLPGLNMVVSDEDLGENAHFNLGLKSADRRAMEWFRVEPSVAFGRTPVVIRVHSNSGLDYDTGLRQIQFTVVCYVHTTKGEALEVSSSDVVVTIVDANDNAPIFNQASYSFTIPEDTPPGSNVANISAIDLDSGEFGKIAYSLKGFGTNKFGTESFSGNLYLTGKVDYEKQKSYSLSMEARDGGGRVSTVSLLISLSDVNDNPPEWELSQYQRTVREGATVFQPQFFIRALDADKDGESQITYKVLSSNSEILSVDYRTGEVRINAPVSSEHTSRGQYEMVVRAFDDGSPPLHADVPVFVRVGVPGNQRPVFRGVPYNVTIPETTIPGKEILTVRATDPDGPDTAVQYRIANGADNFQINESSGVMTVSQAAILDPDVTMTTRYNVIVLAVDSGGPVKETAQTTVIVNIKDINNKPPSFLPNANYVRHISERTEINKKVLNVEAIDPDQNADLEYQIINVRAVHKSGTPVTETHVYDFTKAFIIDKETGEIKVNSHLSHQSTAVIILTIEVKDKNAEMNVEQQYAKVEVTIYIQAYDEQNPKFTVGGWTPLDPVIALNIQEERPIGSTLFALTAVDPTTSEPITKFSLIPPLPSLVGLDDSGAITVVKRIDYEYLKEKTISFRVGAASNDNMRVSEAHIILNIEDINDHMPEFKQGVYHGKVVESAGKNTVVLQVEAVDNDESNTTLGFGDVTYSLSGENAALFYINASTGEIKVSGNGTIDREKEPVLRLVVTASDTPLGGSNQRKSSVAVVIEVEDVNDNPPLFSAVEYTAVVLENVPEGTSVVNVSATDLDSGEGGIVEYEIADQPEAAGLFKINQTTGELKTNIALTGKGRIEPYILTVRAQDKGSPSLFSDVSLKAFIGDVVTNDGIPFFIHPTVNETAYISENTSIGAPVFRVVASDPDNPNSPEGQVRYSFLQDGADSLAFNIDMVTGLITTRETLDREMKSNYSLILVAQDSGMVPQHTTRQLNITVSDIDDNKPVFKRSIDEEPLEFSINEEVNLNTTVGIIEAFDADIGENANIGYLITFGNEDGLFSLKRLENNSVLLLASGRLDREIANEHLLTVKCFKLSTTPLNLRKAYNRVDLSERQIKINIIDLDDNLPRFINNNITVGVRVNVPHDTLLYTLTAVDDDADARPIVYSIESVEFTLPPTSHRDIKSNFSIFSAFILDNSTGELRTAASMSDYYDGHFTIKVSASNRMSNESSFATVKIYVVRDRGLMKFIFGLPPNEIRANLEKFKKDVEEALDVPVSLNVYDTQFFAKSDGSLDFSSTSSCFQLVGAHMFDVKEMERLMSPSNNPAVDKVYKKHNVLGVQRCAPSLAKAEITWVQLCLLGIASFIGVASLISGCVLCCSYNRWQRIR